MIKQTRRIVSSETKLPPVPVNSGRLSDPLPKVPGMSEKQRQLLEQDRQMFYRDLYEGWR